jgi:hypothetical protein
VGVREERGETYKREDIQPLLEVRERDGIALGHAPQDRSVDVVRAIRRTEDEDPVCAREQAVPLPGTQSDGYMRYTEEKDRTS